MSAKPIAFWALMALACASLSAIVLFSYGYLLDGDAYAFLVVGRGLISGSPAYLGLWDHKPPGIYEITALAVWLNGANPSAALQGLSALAIGATAALLGGLIAKLAEHRLAGGLTALFAALALSEPQIATGGGMSELFAAFFMTLAFVGASFKHDDQGRDRRWAAALAGLGLGLALGVSLLSVAVIPALVWLWLRRPDLAGPSLMARLDLGALAYFVGGSLVATGFAWGPVLASGGLSAGIDAVFHYSALYRSLSIWDPNLWLNTLSNQGWLFLPSLAILSDRVRHSRLFMPSLLWLAGVAGVLLAGIRLYPHYLLLAVPVMALMAGLALAAPPWYLVKRDTLRSIRDSLDSAPVIKPNAWRMTVRAFIHSLITDSGLRELCIAILLALVIGAGVAYGSWNALAAPENYGPDIAANQAVAAFIEQLPDQSGPIYVWGTNPDLYLRTHRLATDRYFYLLPLMTPDYGPATAAELLRSWQVQAPTVIVDSSAPAYGRGANAPLLVEHPANAEDGRTLSSDMDVLRAFVSAHYQLAVTIGGQPIYVLDQP